MLTDEDKRRIEAEEAYRASLRQGATAPQVSQVKVGFKREAGSVMFRIVGTFVVILVGLGSCALLTLAGK
jgi:hypothetical protein